MKKEDRLRGILEELQEKSLTGDGALRIYLNKSLTAILKEFEGLEKTKLTKEEFHTIACEYVPKTNQHVPQPMWTKGELDELWEALTKGHWLNIQRKTPQPKGVPRKEFLDKVKKYLNTISKKEFLKELALYIDRPKQRELDVEKLELTLLRLRKKWNLQLQLNEIEQLSTAIATAYKKGELFEKGGI